MRIVVLKVAFIDLDQVVIISTFFKNILEKILQLCYWRLNGPTFVEMGDKELHSETFFRLVTHVVFGVIEARNKFW